MRGRGSRVFFHLGTDYCSSEEIVLEVYVLIVYYEDILFGDKNPRDFNQKGLLFIRGTDNHIVTQKFMSDPDEL